MRDSQQPVKMAASINQNIQKYSNKTADKESNNSQENDRLKTLKRPHSRNLGIIKSVKEEAASDSVDESEVPLEQYPMSTISAKAVSKVRSNKIQVQEKSPSQSSTYLSNDFEQEEELETAPIKQPSPPKNLNSIQGQLFKSLESASSSQGEPKQTPNIKMAPKPERMQRKFSLVPFSRDLKKRNSDYTEDDSFEPYETSNNFPQSQRRDVAQNAPPAQEVLKRNATRKPIEITPEKVVTVPPLEAKFRITLPTKIHTTKVIESAVSSANTILQKVHFLSQGVDENCSMEGSPQRHANCKHTVDQAQDKLQMCTNLNLPQEMVNYVLDISNIQLLREALRLMSEASKVLAQSGEKKQTNSQRTSVQRLKLATRNIDNLSQSFDTKSNRESQIGVGGGSQQLAELTKLVEKHSKIQLRAQHVSDPTYMTQLRQEVKVTQKNLDGVLQDYKRLQAASQQIEQTFKRIEKGKLPLIDGAESHVTGAINSLNFNSQKTQQTSEKVGHLMRLNEITQIKLAENKEKYRKLLLVAKKYSIDVLLIKDCLRGGPDPLLQDGEAQLAKAEASLQASEGMNHKLKQKLNEMLSQKQDLAQINNESRQELTQKVIKAKSTQKQSSLLRSHIDKEGTYNLLQLEKAKKQAQLLLGIPQLDPSELSNQKCHNDGYSVNESSPAKLASNTSESVFLTQERNNEKIELVVSEGYSIKDPTSRLVSQDGRAPRSSATNEPNNGTVAVTERSRESEKSDYSSDRDFSLKKKQLQLEIQEENQKETKQKTLTLSSDQKKSDFLVKKK